MNIQYVLLVFIYFTNNIFDISICSTIVCECVGNILNNLICIYKILYCVFYYKSKISKFSLYNNDSLSSHINMCVVMYNIIPSELCIHTCLHSEPPPPLIRISIQYWLRCDLISFIFYVSPLTLSISHR